MKTSQQIWIDRNMVKPFVVALNLLVRLVGKILNLDHNLAKDFSRIAICKYKGMGSIIQASALIASLRQRYPNAKVAFISSESNRAILAKFEEIDQLILLDDRNLFQLLKSYPVFLIRLIRHRFSLYIDLEIYSNFSSLTTTQSLAQNRIGFYLSASQYRLGVYTHMMFFNTRVPIMQTYLQVARLLGITNLKEKLLPLAPDSFYNLSSELQNLEAQAYFVVNPNASDLRVERRWPAKNFIEMIKELRQIYPDKTIILIGIETEKAWVDGIYQRFESDKKVLNLAGKTNLNGLIFLLHHARLLITNDTGPMHLGAASGTPTIALFGPCAPEQYGGMEQVYPIYKSVYCSPCVHEFERPPCNGNNQCMQLITVNEVITAISKVLTKKIDYTPPQFTFTDSKANTLGVVKRS